MFCGTIHDNILYVYIIMYSFCIDNKFNIVAIPKCGCTQVIKYISQFLNIFDLHQHSFTHNVCNKSRNIHSCGSSLYSYNSKLPTYLITRPIELRVLSYFKANYYHHKIINDNPTFEYFVNNLDLYYKHDIHHIGMISDEIKKRGIKVDYLLDLRNIEVNLNNLFNKYNIKYTFVKDVIVNNTTNKCQENYHDLSEMQYKNLNFPVTSDFFLNNKILEKIRIFYKKDLDYYINSTTIEDTTTGQHVSSSKSNMYLT